MTDGRTDALVLGCFGFYMVAINSHAQGKNQPTSKQGTVSYHTTPLHPSIHECQTYIMARYTNAVK
jgi:hypothetical protein